MFRYCLSPPDCSAIDDDEHITVTWAGGLGRRTEKGEVGGNWRFTHPQWAFSVLVEGEEDGHSWEWDEAGKPTEVFGPSPRIVLHTFDKRLKAGASDLPSNAPDIVADAMLCIYSKGGTYPGTIEFHISRKLKKSYAPNQ